jgi:hypothetical protein
MKSAHPEVPSMRSKVRVQSSHLRRHAAFDCISAGTVRDAPHGVRRQPRTHPCLHLRDNVGRHRLERRVYGLAGSCLVDQLILVWPTADRASPPGPPLEGFAFRRSFQVGNVELRHLEHRFSDAFGLGRVGISHKLAQPLGRDLPA